MTLPVLTSPEEFHRLELSIADLIIFCTEIQNWFVYPYSIGVPINGPMKQLKAWRALDENDRKKQATAATAVYQQLIGVLVNCDKDLDRFQRSLLGLAVEEGYFPLMVDLLKAGANLHVTPRRGESPLYYAAAKNRLDMVRLIIKEYKDREREKLNITHSIDEAIRIGAKPKSFAALLESKGVIHHHQSGASLFNPTAEVLINNANDLIGMIQHPRILRVLMEEGLIHYGSWLMDAVFYAITNNRKDLLDVFFEKEIDFNFNDEKGNTPLILAAKLGYTHLIEPLVKAGAGINDNNKQGRTPIVEAATHHHAETVETLKKQGATYDLNAPHGIDILSSTQDFDKDMLPEECLIRAAEMNKEEVFFKLLASGHGVDKQNQEGFTALMYAASQGNLKMVRALIEAKADLNLASKSRRCKETGQIWGGSTPLMWAAEKGQKEAVKLLILAGADLTLKNHAGKTAQDWAKEGGHLDLLPILRVGLVRQFYRKLVASSLEAVPELILEQRRAGLTQEDLFQFMLKTETEPEKLKTLLNQALDKNTSLGLYLSTSQPQGFKTFFSPLLKPTQARIQQELFKLEPKKPSKGLTYN